MVIWRFHFLVHLLEAIVSCPMSFCAAHLLHLPQHPLDFKGQLRWGGLSWLWQGSTLFFWTLCALFTWLQLGTYTEIKKKAGKYGWCVKHTCFSFSSHWTYCCHQHEKKTFYGIGILFPKIPIQFDVARELTFPSLASLIACLSPEPGERIDVYSVSREISQREIPEDWRCWNFSTHGMCC